MKTRKYQYLDRAYTELSDCYNDIKLTTLTLEEEQKARRLVNFCRIICDEFKDDDRFKDLFQRFTEINH